MLDRDRTSYSFKAAFGAHTQGSFNFEIEPENIILVALSSSLPLPALKASHALSGSKTPIGLATNSREESCFRP
jgi:hypothetical protein